MGPLALNLAPPAQPVAAVNLVALVLITSLVVATVNLAPGPLVLIALNLVAPLVLITALAVNLAPLVIYQKIVAVDPSSSNSEHIHVYNISMCIKQAVSKPYA